MKKYYKTCGEYIIAAGLAKEGKPLLDIAAELEATVWFFAIVYYLEEYREQRLEHEERKPPAL